jgi:hypothetical protein
MPLSDHFHEPLSLTRPWEGFHSAWAAMIADQLNATMLPPGYVALPHVRRGTAVEVDVATLQESHTAKQPQPQSKWTVSPPTSTLPVDWNVRDLFEVRVVNVEGPPRLVAAIELISPANKDRPAHRQAFAGKCAGYLRQGIGLIIVDVVTDRQMSLHQELLDLLELESSYSFQANLYAVAYRTVEAESQDRIEIWTEALAVGQALPTLPLWLTPEFAIPVDLEATYQRTCQSLRIE